MAPNVEISIPTATSSHTSPPYTIYNITLRLPLRSFAISKRYSDFVAFHTSLLNQTNAPPPAPLPGKHWFSNTVSNPTLREERRQGLESYLRAINEADDPRWRNSSAWRAFLNLPSSAVGNGSTTTSAQLHAAITEPGAVGTQSAITDPTLWLDCYRDMKAHLHDARLHLTRRDQETTPQKQHESSARAKSSLVRAGSLIGALEDGLKNLGESNADARSVASGKRGAWGSGNALGEGEIRRRKDLLVNARKEKNGLEDLLNAMAAKSRIDNAVASIQDKEALVGSASRKPARSGRVLGKETERTRELDNQGVLQLQKQTMEDQDMSIEELRKIVQRQKELGIAINAELEIQNELLKLTDEDTDRYVSTLVPALIAHFNVCRLKVTKEDRNREKKSWQNILIWRLTGTSASTQFYSLFLNHLEERLACYFWQLSGLSLCTVSNLLWRRHRLKARQIGIYCHSFPSLLANTSCIKICQIGPTRTSCYRTSVYASGPQ
jgi:regulator of vacuolar morphogenesis